jgi:hypothetical protein
MINRLRPQSLQYGAIVFAAIIAFFLAGCGYGSEYNYFEFDSASGTITGYDDDGPKDVTLPSSIGGKRVTAIGKNAFRDKQLTGVNIYTGIITIGEGAFAENKLTSVTILGVVTIEASAFEDNRLETVTIPDSVVKIRKKAFANNLLTDVTFNSGVDSAIGEDAFSGNPLTSITIGSLKTYASDIIPNFGTVYNSNGKQAGTYTRINSSTSEWTKTVESKAKRF